jgi:hypothetical protein
MDAVGARHLFDYDFFAKPRRFIVNYSCYSLGNRIAHLFSVDNDGYLFQRRPGGLDEEEVHYDKLDEKPDIVYYVICDNVSVTTPSPKSAAIRDEISTYIST